MIHELNDLMIGFDLCRDYSQISFYNRKKAEPVTASTEAGEERYLIETPQDLFPLIEDRVELGTALLSKFIKECIARIATPQSMNSVYAAVTMERMKQPFIQAIIDAFAMLGIERERIYLQDYKESFCSYALNQRRELWSHNVALFEYTSDCIKAYNLSIDYGTKPALVMVENAADLILDEKVRGNKGENAWNQERDNLFLQLILNMFEEKTFSSIFLVGGNFDKTWAVDSLKYLCNRRHVFQGRNLYTKGACYSVMKHFAQDSMKEGKHLKDYLYAGSEVVAINIGMQMVTRGKESYYPLIGAGNCWYESYYTCEFILDHMEEVILYTKPMKGGYVESYSIPLDNLPERPNRTTRIEIQILFESSNKCKVYLRDLGFGGLYPSSGQIWVTTLDL